MRHFYALSILLVLCARTEAGSHLSTVLQLTALAPSGTGRPNLMDQGNKFIALYDRKNEKLCSGTVIAGGCVLTARHCATGDLDVHRGFALDFTKSKPFREITKSNWKLLGKKGDPGSELAVMKLDVPLPLDNDSIAMSDLATKRMEIKKNPKTGADFTRVVAVGFGHSNSLLTIDEKTKNLKTENQGSDVRRVNQMLALGYGKDDDEVAGRGQPVSTEGNVLFLGADPHKLALGDSGAGIIHNGLLTAVFSTAVVADSPGTQPGEEPRPKGETFTNEITANKCVSIPDNLEAIKKAVKELGCEANDQKVYKKDLEEAFAEAGGQKRPFDWKKFEGDDRLTFNNKLRDMFGWPEDAPITIETIPHPDPKAPKEVTRIRISKTSQPKSVAELDLEPIPAKAEGFGNPKKK